MTLIAFLVLMTGVVVISWQVVNLVRIGRSIAESMALVQRTIQDVHFATATTALRQGRTPQEAAVDAWVEGQQRLFQKQGLSETDARDKACALLGYGKSRHVRGLATGAFVFDQSVSIDDSGGGRWRRSDAFEKEKEIVIAWLRRNDAILPGAMWTLLQAGAKAGDRVSLEPASTAAYDYHGFLEAEACEHILLEKGILKHVSWNEQMPSSSRELILAVDDWQQVEKRLGKENVSPWQMDTSRIKIINQGESITHAMTNPSSKKS